MTAMNALLLALAASVSPPDPTRGAARDERRLEGTWEVVSVELGGARYPDWPALRFVFRGDAVTLRYCEGPREETGRYSLKSAGDSLSLVFYDPKDGEAKGFKMKCSLSGETLRLEFCDGGCCGRPFIWTVTAKRVGK
jgi:hypothetical protein